MKVSWRNSVNTMQAVLVTHTRLGQCCHHSCIQYVHSVCRVCVRMLVTIPN